MSKNLQTQTQGGKINYLCKKNKKISKYYKIHRIITRARVFCFSHAHDIRTFANRCGDLLTGLRQRTGAPSGY